MGPARIAPARRRRRGQNLFSVFASEFCSRKIKNIIILYDFILLHDILYYIILLLQGGADHAVEERGRHLHGGSA